MIQSVRETSELILSHSRKRWLSPTEIFVLLSHEPHETGLVLQTNPILNPKGEDISIFNFDGLFNSSLEHRWSTSHFRRTSLCSTQIND